MNILSPVPLARLHRHSLIGSHSLFPIAPRNLTEHSCICGAGFAQEQHLTRHKRNCSTPIETAKERAFEEGVKHKHRPTAKRKRTDSRRSEHCIRLQLSILAFSPVLDSLPPPDRIPQRCLEFALRCGNINSIPSYTLRTAIYLEKQSNI